MRNEDEAEVDAGAQEPETPHPWNKLVEQVFSPLKKTSQGKLLYSSSFTSDFCVLSFFPSISPFSCPRFTCILSLPFIVSCLTVPISALIYTFIPVGLYVCVCVISSPCHLLLAALLFCFPLLSRSFFRP